MMLQQRQLVSADSSSFLFFMGGSPGIAWVDIPGPAVCQLPKELHAMVKARGWRLRLHSGCLLSGMELNAIQVG